MRAIVLPEFGDPDVLEFGEVDTPQPGAGQVRVRVRASIVSRAKDVGARSGQPPFGPRITFPHVLGAEYSGVIDAVGEGVDPALVDQRVAVSAVVTCESCRACLAGRDEACPDLRLTGVDSFGSYAQYAVANQANVFPIPDEVSFEEAAALAANGPVARAQLSAANVVAGDYVVVLGAAGSLGSAAAALANWRDAKVIAVDRLEGKSTHIEAVSPFVALDGDREDLAGAILGATDNWGADCVVDNLGLVSLWERYSPALASMGTVVVSGAVAHDLIPMSLRPFYLRCQSLLGVRTGNRAQQQALWEDVRQGFRLPSALVTPIPWTEVSQSHRLVEQGLAQGQIVLQIE